MAKMSRRQLKTIVKECLVEILSEGLQNKISAPKKPSRDRENFMRLEETRLRKHRQKFETDVVSSVSSVTSDPMMQEILSDTARTTLQEQLSHEGPNSPQSSLGGSSPGGAGIDLDSLFSDPKENWSQLAFKDDKSS